MHTLWRCVRDHSNLIWYFLTSTNHQVRAIKFSELDFSKGAEVTHFPMQSDNWYVDVSDKLK